MTEFLSDMPIWATEFFVATAISILGAILYGTILYVLNRINSQWVNVVKKIINIVVALFTWAALLYEKIQQGMKEVQISFNESILFYMAIVIAVVALVHASIESAE